MQYIGKIKPKKLNKSDTIGIIAPAGAVRDYSTIERAQKYFKQKGYKVKISKGLYESKRYLAGDDELRASELMKFFADDEVKAVICARGGYGTYRILDKLDYEVIAQNPKIFIGYSDITALHLAISEKSNMVTYHGPLALSDFGGENIDEYTEKVFWDIVEEKTDLPYVYENTENYFNIKTGKAEGELFAGNLTVLCGLLGTDYFPDLTNKIIILEDIAEPLYKIDRMLTQLKLAGVIQNAKGLLFANFTDMAGFENENDKINAITEVIIELFGELTIPIGYGFSASHSLKKATLAVGAEYTFISGESICVLQLNKN
ncbi:MAG: LD-carboxypeptidase [bacterium]